MLYFLWNFTLFLISMIILIVVHELGHFITARKLGICVECFSIGFGPKILGFKDKYNTEYIISAIPLGGYVKISHESIIDYDSKNTEHDKLSYYKSVFYNLIVIISGPLFNFIFSIFVYWIIFTIGFSSYRPIVHDVIPNSVIDKAGISPKVEIKSINNVKTPDWEAVRFCLLENINKKKYSVDIELQSLSSNLIEKKTLIIDKSYTKFINQNNVSLLGMIMINIKISPILSKVYHQSLAEMSGFKTGDKIISVNGKEIDGWKDFLFKIRNSDANRFIEVLVERSGDIIHLNVYNDHELISKGFLTIIGMTPTITCFSMEDQKIIYKYFLFSSFIKSCKKVWQLTVFTFKMFIKLFCGDVQFDILGGPISIAKNATISANYGIIYYLMFLAMVSINLGVINLFPIPLLDGGRFLYLILENLFLLKFSTKLHNFINYLGLVFLIILMIIIFLNDIIKILI